MRKETNTFVIDQVCSRPLRATDIGLEVIDLISDCSGGDGDFGVGILAEVPGRRIFVEKNILASAWCVLYGERP
jgi:hypothetical protein